MMRSDSSDTEGNGVGATAMAPTPDWRAWLGIVGRIGLASLFVLGGVNKIATFPATAARMEDVGLTPTAFLLPATIALELIGGLWVASGLRFYQLAAAALAVFTLATNWYFHRFWELDGVMAQLELSLFFKNVAIAGALLFVAANIQTKHEAR